MKRDVAEFVVILIALWICLLAPGCCFAQAGERHGAVYRLHTETNADYQGGSGSCVAIDIQTDSRVHFLTIEHALKGSNWHVQIHNRHVAVEYVTHWNTHPEPIVLIRSKQAYDNNPAVRCYPLATQSMVEGEKCYTVGFQYRRGANQSIYTGLANRVVKVHPNATDNYYNLAVKMDSGASGGPLLNAKGEIAGIISGIDDRLGLTFCANLVSATEDYKAGRQIQWNCYQGQCRPTYQYRQPYFSVPIGPPVVRQVPKSLQRKIEKKAPILPTQPTQPATIVRQSIDKDELAAEARLAAVDWLEKHKAELKGRDGEDGAPGAPAKVDLEELAALIMRKYGSQLKGEPGETGGDGPVGMPTTSQIAAVVNQYMEENKTQRRNAFILLGNPKDFPNKPLIEGNNGEQRAFVDEQIFENNDAIVLDLEAIFKAKEE